MKFVQIPRIDDVWDKVAITSLSPSTFLRVEKECAYQMLAQKALETFQDKSLLLPISKNAVLGIIVHKIYELTTKNVLKSFADMSVKWDMLINEKETALKNNYITLNNVRLNDYDKRNKCFRNALKMLENKSVAKYNNKTNATFYSEYLIDCTDIGLRGIIDNLYISNGKVEITDYKSGSVLDEDGLIKEEYIAQMNLYATMCKHKGLGQSFTSTIIDINGTRFDIDYNLQKANDYLQRVQTLIILLNKTVKNRTFDQVIKGDVEKCQQCSVRHICEKQSFVQNAQFATIIGNVSNIISSNLYELSMASGRKIFVSGLSRYSIETDYYLNKKLSFVNLINSGTGLESDCYRVTDNTIIYELQ